MGKFQQNECCHHDIGIPTRNLHNSLKLSSSQSVIHYKKENFLYSPSHRWRLEIESGGYSRPGYSQLGERGQVEPDKWPLVLVRLCGQAEPSLECDGGGRLWSINSKLQKLHLVVRHAFARSISINERRNRPNFIVLSCLVWRRAYFFTKDGKVKRQPDDNSIWWGVRRGRKSFDGWWV